MKCPACDPSKDYDLLFNCQECGQSFCKEHMTQHQHSQRTPYVEGQNIDPSNLMQQFAQSFLSQMQQQTREPTDEEYEAYLRQNPRILTTGRESLDLLIGVLLIAWVFGFIPISQGLQSWQYVVMLTLVISPAFILHELAHKFMAIKYGKYARFALVRQMVLFTFFAGLFYIPIAGPGATMILGKSNDRENGIFSAVGPLTNFLLSATSYVIYLMIPGSIFISSIGMPLAKVFLLSTFINAGLGVFNLLPFGPFDGNKILTWNAAAWMSLIILNAPMIYLAREIFLS